MTQYLSYLLRLWQVSSDGEQVWRASSESPGTGERRGFANVECLFTFLQEKTQEVGERKGQAKDTAELKT